MFKTDKIMHNLGRVQIAILKELRDDSMDKATLYQSIRNSQYKYRTPKCISRHRIRSAIRSLKQRNLITEQYGILSRNK